MSKPRRSRLLARLPGWLRDESATARRLEDVLDARAPRLLATSRV